MNKSRGKKSLGNAAKSDTGRETLRGSRGNLENKMENAALKIFVYFKMILNEQLTILFQ